MIPIPLTIGGWNFEVLLLDSHFPKNEPEYLGINLIKKNIIIHNIMEHTIISLINVAEFKKFIIYSNALKILFATKFVSKFSLNNFNEFLER